MSVSGASSHTQAIKDILEAESDASWTDSIPNIRFYRDDPPSEKGPGAGQPPVVYVWSPTSTDLPQFSSDGDLFDRQSSVEILVYSLDDTECEQVQNDVVQIISSYFADNKVRTEFNDIRPSTKSDYRSQKNAGRTDHFIMGVEATLRGLDDTALPNH